MALSVSVCLCVTIVRTGPILVKIKDVQMLFEDIEILPSNGVIAKIVLRYLYQHF